MTPPCSICGKPTSPIGSKVGKWRAISYELVRCTDCAFAFVTNPSVDFENVYSEDYYAGCGADSLVDYTFELSEPSATIRTLEWRGIDKIVRSVVPLGPQTRWLDYGCGSGGLVRHLRSLDIAAEGYEESPIVSKVRALGIPVLEQDELDDRGGFFDVVSAIEVIEHLVDPIRVLEKISRLLKPGGIAFFTTGNATRFRSDLLSWSYFIPEIHIGLYEPQSLERGLALAGLESSYLGWQAGYNDVITFKILKNLKVNRMHSIYEVIARSPLPRLANQKYGVSEFPIGVKPS